MMILTTTLGHGWHLTCPDCLRALACPLCEDARELAKPPPQLFSTVGENSS